MSIIKVIKNKHRSNCRSQQVLEFVTSPGPSTLTRSLEFDDDIEKCEVCPDAGVITSFISRNVAEHGGAFLAIDYGVERSDRFSLRVRN